MTIQIRHIQLRVLTATGSFGTDVRLGPGLNVIWADNTMGKSTTLQAVLFALGLERMLSARREIPLTYVMTSHLIEPDTQERLPVVASWVAVELTSHDRGTITVKRSVVGGNTKLVTVLHGPALSDPGSQYKQTDFFVLDPGAAQREAGFHRFLADFFGWSLPRVLRFDGSETMLYLETVFPLLYVEQKAGWSAIPAAVPTYFQIRDVGRRAVEFLLAMDAQAVEHRRQQIDLDLSALRSQWLQKRDEVVAMTRLLGARIAHFPAAPPLDLDAIDRIAIQVRQGDEWLDANEALAGLNGDIALQQETQIPTIGEIAGEISVSLSDASKEMDELSSRRVALLQARRQQSANLESTEQRIRALEEDLQKNLDVLKLRRLGSVASLLAPEHCPTCDRPLQDALLPPADEIEVMPIEENVEYIRAQLSMFRQSAQQSNKSVKDLSDELDRVATALRETSARIRAIKADLVTPENTPSAAVIAVRLQAEQRATALESTLEDLEGQKSFLSDLAIRNRDLAIARASLPTDRLTDEDRSKLQELTLLIRQQIAAYGFSTFDADELSVSAESYRPEKEGFEIGFQLSASDAIRLKWAYQLALLELARTRRTNHPGFVVFDEPRQQEARRVSFQRLLERAAESLGANQQVLFSTSEDLELLQTYVEGLDCNLIEFSGQIVKRLVEA